MAPTKRTGAAAGAAPSKKAKVAAIATIDPSASSKCSAVAKALRGAKDILPAHCTKMLEAVLPHCVAGAAPVGSPALHACQVATAALVSKALAEIETPLVARLEEAQKEQQLQQEERATAQSGATAADGALEEQNSAVSAQGEALAEATKGVETAEAAVKAAKAAVEAHAEDLKAVEDQKAKAEAAMSVNLAAVQAGAWTVTEGEAVTEDKAHLEVILPLCATLELEDSMTQALPLIASRRAEERTSFDTLTLNEVEKRLTEYVTNLIIKIGEKQAATAELEAAVEAGQSSVGAAQELQATTTTALEAAHSLQEQAMVANHETKVALTSASKALKGAESSLASAQKQLTSFKEGPLASFESLRTFSVEAEEDAVMKDDEAGKLTEEAVAEPTVGGC